METDRKQTSLKDSWIAWCRRARVRVSTSMVPSFICFLLFCVSCASAKDCGPDDFHSEFTECDSQNGRWLVWVPKNCTGGFPPSPQRHNNCLDASCNPGQFVDLTSEIRECKPCGPGYYSLGSAQRFDNWTNELFDTNMFTITPDSFTSGDKVNCSGQGWRVVSNRLIATISDACSSELTFSAKLSRRGYARFTYQFTDPYISFQFDVSNGRCGSPQLGNKPNFMPEATNASDSSRFYSHFVALSSGVNILRWTVAKFAQSLGRKSSSSSSSDSSRWQAPQVRIGSIEVNGLSYVAKCTPCPAGTYNKGGSGNCTLCERNYYSTAGSSECIPCAPNEYAEPGWASCLPRPPCSSQHYFVRPGACVNGYAELRASWIEPKVCVDGESLPEALGRTNCSVCNRGMTLIKSNDSRLANSSDHDRSSCQFCPPERPFSNGDSECQPCPPNTVEQFGLAYHWFNELPLGLHTMCASISTDSCPGGVNGWQAAGSYLRTSPLLVHSQKSSVGIDLGDYFQLLVLHIDDGFLSPPGLPSGSFGDDRPNFEYARLNVELEVFCAEGHECELTLSESRHHRSSSGRSGPLRTWENTAIRQTFSYGVRSPGQASFTFAFNYNVTASSSRNSGAFSRVSEARIFSIVLSNVKGAGAIECKKCENKENEQCVPCPDGSYIRSDGTCAPCPLNTVSYASKLYTLIPDIPRGIDACMPCGPGLKPDASRSRCILDCSNKLIGSNFTFDLAAFSGVHTVTSHRVFSPQGQPFFYLLNLTVCEYETVVHCVPPPPSNITNWRIRFHSSLGQLAEYEDEDFMYGQLSCYVTVLSNAFSTGSASGTRSRSATVLPGPDDGYFAPVNLGMAINKVLAPGVDELTRINLTNLLVDAGFESSQSDTDVFIIYENIYEGSEACPDGRYLVLTLRCDPDTPTNATSAIELPPNCPEGTCDGCVYVVMWRSRAACPTCDPEKDIRTLVGECVRGQQTVYYEPAPHCYYRDTQQLASRSQVRSCPYLPLEGYIALGIAALLLIGACGAACAYRSKTRKLEYKYMRLVQQAGGQYAGELAGAESCAVQEGELDESAVDESVEPTQKSRQKHKATKKRSGNGQQAFSNDAGSDAGASDEDEINVDFKNMKLQPMRSESGDPKISALSRIMDRFKKNEDRGSSLMDEDDA